MPKHDVIVVGDSLAAIHCALELARDGISVLLIRPDSFPIDVYETNHGAFDCNLASSCDMSYYLQGEKAKNLYGLNELIEKLPIAYRIKTTEFYFEEPTGDYDFQVGLVRMFPAYKSEIMSFLCRTKFIHELADEIETKIGEGTFFKNIKNYKLFLHLTPWTYNEAKSLISQSFSDFLCSFNLPNEFNKLYEVMCSDQLGLGADSVDALSGVELITRRFHGLSYLKGGWSLLKSAMLDEARSAETIRIIGGKRIDLIKSGSGFITEIYVDERGSFTSDFFVIDETLGLLRKEPYGVGCNRYVPIGGYSLSHMDFRLFAAWENKPKGDIPIGVNYIYRDLKYPPHAPHLIRFDIMPPNVSDLYGMALRLTARAQYPWERVVSSSGSKVSDDDIKSEILRVLNESFSFGEPLFIKFLIPRIYHKPQTRDLGYRGIIPVRKLASENFNLKMIYATTPNGGSMRLAFRRAERIASGLKRELAVRKKLREFVSTPLTRTKAFIDITRARMEEIE